jgi:RecA-family ATPase
MNSRFTPLREAEPIPSPLPANVEAEQALIGAIFVDNAAFSRVALFLRAEHFAYPVHGRIYIEIAALIERGQLANPITLKAKFERDGVLTDIGGAEYLARLAASAVTTINAFDYARVIAETAQRRELAVLGNEIAAGAFAGVDPVELLDQQRREMIRIADIGRQQPARAVIDPTTLQGALVPARPWICPDWIPDHAVTGISGTGGIGKSLLAQQLLTATAIGADWLGMPVTQRRSLYFACEDSPDELHRRQADINLAYACGFADLATIRWMPRLGHDNLLMTFAGGLPALTPAFAELAHEARAFGARLVIVDTVADSFGGNESDRGQVRHFVQACLGRLAREIGGGVIALGHPSRSGQADGSGQSGSTGWDASFRSRLYLGPAELDKDAEPSDSDTRILARKKANYARRHDQIELRWVDGVLVPSVSPRGAFAAADRQHAERVFLELLDKSESEGRFVSHRTRAGNYAPKMFARHPDREGLRQADFDLAMQRLFAALTIKVGARKAADRKIYDVIVRSASE